MKNIFKYLPLAIIAVMASCARNEIVQPAPEVKKMLVTLSTEETKTAFVYNDEDNKYHATWTEGDRLGVFVRKGSDYVTDGQNIPTSALVASTEVATFTVGVSSPQEDCQYDFYAYYPYNELEGSEYSKVRVEIPAVQYPVNGSFDPKADILTGYPQSADLTAGQTSLDGLLLRFLRKTAVVKLTPNSCSGFDGISSDTYVTEVQVEFDKDVVGIANWDIREMDGLTLEEDHASNKVTVMYDEGTHKISDPIWLSIAPVSEIGRISFSFKVGESTYLCAASDLSSKKQNFDSGKIKAFNVPISAAKWDLKTLSDAYELVTKKPSDWKGEYLIVCKNGGKYYASNQITGPWGKCSEVTVEDNKIAVDGIPSDYVYTVVDGTVAGSYAFMFNDGKYLSTTVSKFDKVDEKTSGTDVSISLETSLGNAVNIYLNSDNVIKLRYNTGASYGLRFYNKPNDSNTITLPYLFRRNTVFTDALPVFGEIEAIDKIPAEGVTDAKLEVSVTNLGKYEVSAECDGEIVTKVSVDYSDGKAVVTYTVSENDHDERDEGWIELSAGPSRKKVGFVQTGVLDAEIFADDQTVGYEASTYKFDITVTHVRPGKEPVCTVDKTVVTNAEISTGRETEVDGTYTYTVTYTVSQNNTVSERSGYITVKYISEEKTVSVSQEANPNTRIYRRVKTIGEVTEGTYIIVASTSTQTGYLQNSMASSSNPKYITSGLPEEKDDRIVLVEGSDSDMTWDFTGTAESVTIKNGDNYLRYSGSGTNVRVENNNSNNQWQITASADNTFFVKNIASGRYCSAYNNQDWRAYNSETQSSATAQIKLYKYDDGKQDSGLAFSVAEKTLGLDDEVTDLPVLEKNTSAAATYKSSDTSVADVDENTGALTLKKVGTTTITASVEAVGDYRAGSASYKLTVNAPERTFSATPESFEISADGATGQTITVTASPKVVWSVLAEDGIAITKCTATKDGENYKGSGDIIFSVAENKGMGRELPILLSTSTEYVTSKEITIAVNQAGTVASKEFKVSPKTIADVPASGATVQFSITTDSEDVWIAQCKALEFKIEHADDEETMIVDGDAMGKGNATISVTVPENTGEARDFNIVVEIDDESVPADKRTQTIKVSQLSGVSIGVLSIDFEKEASFYTRWTFTNMISKATNTNVTPAHGGNYFGTTNGKESASITTKVPVSPKSIKFYISKASGNTNTDSQWLIQTSKDKSTWVEVKNNPAAVGIKQGEWTEVSYDFTNSEEVYVRVAYSGTSALRIIDDLSLEVYGEGDPEPSELEKLATPSGLVCSAQTSSSLTFTWNDVTNATGYSVSLDKGASWKDVAKSTTYTWSDLEPETAYTIYVKAKGDDEVYTDSDSASASGTTDAEQAGGANTVTYTVTSTTAVSTSGTAPAGSSAVFKDTYSTKYQLTKGNTMTLTLKGFAGKKITGIKLSMKSNASAGTGYFSAKSGSTEFASLGASNSGVTFNKFYDNTSYGTSWRNVNVTLMSTPTVGSDEDVVIVIGATVNSLYCQSFEIQYE